MQRNTNAVNAASAARPSQMKTPVVAPVFDWIASVASRIRPLIMEAPRRLAAPQSAPPSHSEQKSKRGGDRERRVRPLLDRLVDRLDKIVRYVAHRADCFLSFGLRVGDHTVNAGLGALPCGVALAGENGGDLVGEAAEIVAQCLQVVLDVARGRSGGVARLAHAFARFLQAVTSALREIGRGIHRNTP